MDKATPRQFHSALAEADKALQLADPFYIPNLHGNDQEDVVAALADDILTRQAFSNF